MAEPFFEIKTTNLTGKIVLGTIVLIVLTFGWFAIRWQIGNMLGALTPPNSPNSAEIAKFSQELSPRDPITNWLVGTVLKDEFSADAASRAVISFEEMVRNAPNDHRAWVELGRALEQNEQFERAEQSFKRAVDLAPNYSFPRWHLSNYLLRRGREDEAVKELRLVAESGREYREQVFALTWEYFEKDVAKIENIAGPRSDVRTDLAKFFAAREMATDSLRIWNTLTAEQKQDHQDVAKVIAQALYEKKFYRSAAAFVHQLALEPQAKAEEIQNGGFESPIPDDAQKVYFNWKVVRAEKLEIRTDQLKKRDGNRALRLNFTGFSAIEIKNFWQVLAVEPGKRYKLGFWVRTENLKSAGTPLIEIVNAVDNKILATSPAFPTDSNDWSQVKVDFNVPGDTEGVLIRLDRAYCGEACPIVGSVWLDDFTIEKL